MSERHADEDTITERLVRTPTRRTPAPADSRARPVRRPAESPERDSLWDANDVAAYLKVSRSWVYRRAEAGLMPYLRVGGLLRFDPDVIRAYARGSR